MSRQNRDLTENKFAGMESVLLVLAKIMCESAAQFHAIFSGFSACRFDASDRAVYREPEEPRGR